MKIFLNYPIISALILFSFTRYYQNAISQELPKKAPAKVSPQDKIVPIAKAKQPAKIIVAGEDININSIFLARKGTNGDELSKKIDASLNAAQITKCAVKIKNIMMALSAGQNAEFIIEPMSSNPNENSNIVTMEIESITNETRFVSLNVNQNCDGFYNLTILWPMNCDEVKAKKFPNFVSNRMLQKNGKLYRLGNNLSLVTYQQNNQCLIIKKEMFK